MISYENVYKTYYSNRHKVDAVKNVTFSVDKGQVVVFLGPSGCGKSTLLRMTNRLEKITHGNIIINNKSIHKIDPVKLRLSIGYVIQQIGLFPNKTVYENIAIVPKILGWKKQRIDERVDELLGMVRLDPAIYRHRYPVQLSGGQQQRVGLARALAADPEIMLMDEPFGAIDPMNRDEIQDQFLNLQGKLKKTVIIVSHDIHEAIKLADKIAIFRNGMLIQYDTPEMILTQPQNRFVADFVGADAALKVLSLMRVRDALIPKPRNLLRAHLTTQEGLRIMEEKRLHYAIVIDAQGKLIGYVTPKLLKYERGILGEFAQPSKVVVEVLTPLRDVLSEMLMHGVTTAAVTNEYGDFKGVITYRDIQACIAEIYQDDAESE